MSKLEKLLNESNELLCSAYSIAERDGVQTNWDAFRNRLKNALDAQHKSGLTQRAPDRLWRRWASRLGSLIVSLGESLVIFGGR